MGPGVPTGPAGRSGVEAGPSSSSPTTSGLGRRPSPAKGRRRVLPLRPPSARRSSPHRPRCPPSRSAPPRPRRSRSPKGGGAIQPLGGTFKTNPSTGTGSYAVPLGLPEARGFSPGLALQYDSGSGNGLLVLAGRSRSGRSPAQPTSGFPSTVTPRRVDTFVLSGAEELVPARRLDGNTWVDDNQETPTHRIVRYRPRTEGAFSRNRALDPQADRGGALGRDHRREREVVLRAQYRFTHC